MLSFNLLGSVQLSKNGKPLLGFRSQKEPAILIYLAHTGQSHKRDHVAEMLWSNRTTKQALSNLRTALARLQKQVGDSLVLTQRSLTLAPEAQYHVDSVQLLQVLTSISHISSAEQAASLNAALDSYHGEFLAGFQLRDASYFDEWMLTTREYIHRQVIAAYQKLGQYALTTGDSECGIAIARRWLQIDELDEMAHMLLLRLLIKVGHIHEAMAHYDSYVKQLQTELALEPSPDITAFIKNVQPKRPGTPRILPTIRHNLPAVHDQFFGRQAAQQAIHVRLDQAWCRLVTIIGPGGVGKTRLATTIARHRLSYYSDGVWLVELAELDPHDENLSEAIAVEIAAALDLRFSSSAPPDRQLLDYLQHRQVLLVLDNIEHVLEGSQIILDIVRQCEQVQLLVTSRQSLQLRAEWTITLDGLSYPASGSDEAPSEAIELFEARRAQHGDSASKEDMLAIRSICRMVEGLPLAIELAAALTRSATPQAIADRLQHGFDALTTSLRDTPRRHHSLKIVFEMSWRTLAPTLQERLARLGVFRGGFTAQAAQQIADANAQHLVALCEKSLLAYNKDAERYSLHPVVRAHADEMRPATDKTPQKHSHYYLTQLAQRAEPLQKHSPQDSIAVLEPDIENIRLAWHTGLAQRQIDYLLKALAPLSLYYQLRGLSREGEETMHSSINVAAAWDKRGSALVARAGLEQARFQNRLGRYWPAILTIQKTLKLTIQIGDQWAEGMAHVLWAESLWRLGEYESARNRLNYALRIAHSIEASMIVGWCHHHLGIIDDIQGHYDTALEHLLQACDVWRSLENINILSVSLNSIGLVRYNKGDLPGAQLAMEQALTICKQIDNRHMQALLLNNLSMVVIEQHDYLTAQHYLQLGLELALASGNVTGQGEICANLGRNYHRLGENTLAIEYLEQGLQLAESLGNRSVMASILLNLAQVRREQGDIDDLQPLYNQALYIAQQDNLKRIECEALIGMAELSSTNSKQAREYSAQAIALAQSLGNPQLLEQAHALAQRLQISFEFSGKNLSA